MQNWSCHTQREKVKFLWRYNEKQFHQKLTYHLMNKLRCVIRMWEKKTFFLIPDFGVSTDILYTIDYSLSCCKLNFGALRYQVKRHSFERIDASRHYICLLYKFLGIISRKRPGQPFLLMLLIWYYLWNEIKLGLGLYNLCWIRKVPNFTTNNIDIWCFTHRI